MPSVLIDSCALLWATGEPARLGPDAREVIAERAAGVSSDGILRGERLRRGLLALLWGVWGVLHAGAGSTTEWTTLGGSPDHARYYPGSLGTTPFSQLWEYTLGPDGSTRSAVVAEDRVFLTGSTGYSNYATALDCRTGAEVWVKESPPGVFDAPSYHRGKLFHAARPGSPPKSLPIPGLRAVHAGSGSRVWSAPAVLDDYGGGAAPVVSDLGVLLAGGRYYYNAMVLGFETETGPARFPASMGSPSFTRI